MIEALIRSMRQRWRREVEVPVFTPTRGVIDLVLRDERGNTVACEAQSEVRRLEQQIRWARTKAEALPLGDGMAATSRLLLLRSSPTTRSIVAGHRETQRAAYPGGHREAVAALVGDAPWPGAAIVWMEVHRGVAQLRDRVPRGVPSW